MIARALALSLYIGAYGAALLGVTQVWAQTAIRPDQICPGGVCGTPDITWGPGGTPLGYVIGSTVAWRADSTTTPTFTVNDAAKTVELTNSGTFSVTLPAATGQLGDGFGFTIQVKTGTVTLQPQAGATISGQPAILVSPYQAVALSSRGGSWYAALSAPVTAATVAGSTFDPANKGTNIVLSSSNMVATSAAAGFQSVRGTTSKSTGKVYFEIGCDAINSNTGLMGGIGNASSSLTSHVGSTANGVGNQVNAGANDASWYYNGAVVLALSSAPASACVAGATNRTHFAVDLGGALIWSQAYTSGTGTGRWNNTAVTAPAAPTTGGVSVPFSGPYFISVSVLGTSPATVTHLYAGAATIEGPVPTGYTVWDSAP